MSVLPSNDECEVISKQAEQDIDIQIKEEIPKPLSFPEIKDEPDEVSYFSVCHQYIKMGRLFSCLLSWSAHLNNCSVGNGNFCLVWGYVNF
jgi:hypothetical protein